jgi:seryl-tRNA synthetase
MSATRHVEIVLEPPATELAQEEITKQVPFLATGIRNVRFRNPSMLECDVDADSADRVEREARALATRMQRSLRSLERKVAYRSAAMDAPSFAGDAAVDGVRFEGHGLALLDGLALRLLQYFDRSFADFGRAWTPTALRAPTLIPTSVLARCDYFRTFPHTVTMACHLPEDPPLIEDFRRRHDQRETLDDASVHDMATPEACLSPAMCYHAFNASRDRVLADHPVVYSMVGKCFRYESSNMGDLRRLWDFTMRELVFLGDRERVLEERRKGIAAFGPFLEAHRLAGEIRTASDPFFVAPDSAAKTYFQLSAETKYEVSLLLPGDARLAVGSFNYHADFFGRRFSIREAGGLPLHSVCFGWGLERWVHAFVAQHGRDPSAWPAVVRDAPEFREAS